MDFNQKLQKLRMQKGLTQEELAQSLFVSRTAISKWESGRGYPNIDSLKAIAKFFSVTVDELLSGEEVLNIAEEDHKQKEALFRDLVFGMLDLSVAMYLFIPIFGQRAGSAVSEVSLLALVGVAPWLKIAYISIVAAIVMAGTFTLVLQNCRQQFWVCLKSKLSLILNVIGVLLFIITLQSYAAIFLFVFLMIKTLLVMKKR